MIAIASKIIAGAAVAIAGMISLDFSISADKIKDVTDTTAMLLASTFGLLVIMNCNAAKTVLWWVVSLYIVARVVLVAI